ncbi:sugar transferase [Aquiflexum sp.]|uniref:sugar transferase n=1 Tax=Aquiflexum sp. TaxID=1872584 RepID=UPI0035946515
MATVISKLNHSSFLLRDVEFIAPRSSVNLFDTIQTGTKRTFDLVFAILFLILIGSWLFTIIAIFIKLESKGPVMFKQLRHGRNNAPFYCLKFRSMKYDPNGHFAQATIGDPRITKAGLFLRKTSLDELPQLFNVLMGEMSLVGPRPHAIIMNQEIAEKVEYFMCRHIVKPGITGLAQAQGYRGEIRNMHDINSRLKYDLFYIKNWSVLFDFKIILLTVKCLFVNNGNAY